MRRPRSARSPAWTWSASRSEGRPARRSTPPADAWTEATPGRGRDGPRVSPLPTSFLRHSRLPTPEHRSENRGEWLAPRWGSRDSGGSTGMIALADRAGLRRGGGPRRRTSLRAPDQGGRAGRIAGVGADLERGRESRRTPNEDILRRNYQWSLRDVVRRGPSLSARPDETGRVEHSH